MRTFQDLQEAMQTHTLESFLLSAIREHENSEEYKIAQLGDDYIREKNTTIKNFRKFLYDVNGRAKLDIYSPNYQIANNFYKIIITQLVHYLLGNGVTFDKPDTLEKLGGQEFNNKLFKIVYDALAEGRSNGYINNGKVYEFKVRECYAFPDEETGAYRAVVRFWQLERTKPLRVTLYLEDGYLEFIQRSGEELHLREGYSADSPRKYKEIVRTTQRDTELGTAEVIDSENYNGLPIIPCFANYNRQAEIVGKREQLDCYDLIESGFANNIDQASYIYWIVNNTLGVDEVELAEFQRRMATLHVAVTEDNTKIEPHTIDPPTQARETLLARLKRDIYTAFMAVDPQDIAAGNVTATAIRAAMTPLDQRADELETCVCDFIQGLLTVLGIEDTPHFTRYRLANLAEETEMVLSAAQYLDTETILRKLPFISADEVQEIIDRRNSEDMQRYEYVRDGNA